MMKWLTLNIIKQHSRIDYDLEDDVLELYGESAEDTVLAIVRRTYEGLVTKYGEVPKALVHASLMLVDLSYQMRSPVNVQSLNLVPYTFEILVKPYMRLSGEEGDEEENESEEETALESAGTAAG